MKLFGKRPVIERLRTDPKSIKKVFMQDGLDHSKIRKLVIRKKVEYKKLNFKNFKNLSKNFHAQGVFAEVDDFKYIDLEDLLETAKNENIVLFFLDGITDPQNFGSMIRTGGCFGGFAFVIPKHRSVEVNETVLRIASGAENYIMVSKVINLNQSIVKAKNAGFSIIGAIADKDAESLNAKALDFPLAVVIGSEGKGLSLSVGQKMDRSVKIPMQDKNISFNAAVALAIFCYEINKQKEEVCRTMQT